MCATDCIGDVEVVLGCIQCVEERELSLSAGVMEGRVSILCERTREHGNTRI